MTTQTDPFAAVRIAQKGPPSSFNPTPEEEEDPFLHVRTKMPEKHEEYTRGDIARVPIGLGARGAETAVGAPGGLQKSFGYLLDLAIGAPTEYFTGKKHTKLRETLRDPFSALGEHREEIEEMERSHLHPEEVSSFSRYPTPEDIKENVTEPLSELVTGEKKILEPKSEEERFAQDFTQDLTALALPGSGVHSWMGRTGLAFAGNSTKEIVKQLGFSPSTQELTKLGTLGILSLASIGNAPRFARQYFQETKALMPRGVRMRTQPLETALNRIKNSDWFRGHNTPSTRAAREMIDSIEQRINRGSMSMRDAMQLRENINELAQSLGAFSVEGTQRTAHVARLNQVRDALIEGMEQTVGRQYPNWWNQYQSANQAFAITQRSSAIGNFIASNYGKPIVSEAGKILFGNAIAKGAAGIAKVGAAGVGLATGAKAITIANRLRNPILRQYYQRVVNASIRADGLAMTNALSKFDEEAIKQEKQEKSTKHLLNPARK